MQKERNTVCKTEEGDQVYQYYWCPKIDLSDNPSIKTVSHRIVTSLTSDSRLIAKIVENVNEVALNIEIRRGYRTLSDDKYFDETDVKNFLIVRTLVYSLYHTIGWLSKVVFKKDVSLTGFSVRERLVYHITSMLLNDSCVEIIDGRATRDKLTTLLRRNLSLQLREMCLYVDSLLYKKMVRQIFKKVLMQIEIFVKTLPVQQGAVVRIPTDRVDNFITNFKQPLFSNVSGVLPGIVKTVSTQVYDEIKATCLKDKSWLYETSAVEQQ